MNRMGFASRTLRGLRGSAPIVVARSGNELYTHFVPITRDFSRSALYGKRLESTQSHPAIPLWTRLITRRSQVQILPPLLQRPCKQGLCLTRRLKASRAVR
jgi:hypothetical protein